MKLLRLLLIPLSFLFSQEAGAQMLLNYATSATQAASAAPTPIRNVEILPNGDIKVTYTFSSALLTTTSVLGKTCYVWSISGFGQNTSSTEAALPRRIDSFQIPEGKTATVSLLSSSYKSFCYNMAAGSSPRNEGSTMTERARPVPSSSVPLPANVVSMVGRTEGSGSGIQKIPVTSNKDGVHIVSLLYDGAIVESKHFLK